MSAWVALSPLLAVAGGGLAVALVDAFVRDKSELAISSATVLLAGAAMAGALWWSGLPAAAPEFVAPFLAVDAMAQLMNIIICVGAALSVMLAGGYLKEHGLEGGEYYVILLFSAFGAMVLASATDLLTIFIGLETMSLGVYCLVAYRRGSTRSAEAGMKYFLLGSFAAAIFLFGAALVYGATGHTDLHGAGVAIGSGEADVQLTLLGATLLIVGLAFKVSAVPFHMWTPDAYEGAVTPTTTFMSVAVKAAAFAVMLRVLIVAFGDSVSTNPHSGWPPIVAGLAVVTMVYGNVAAIYQQSVKRMLAYSSIAHAGYMLVGVVALFHNQRMAVSSVLYYLMAYTVSNVLAFGSLIALGTRGKESVSYEDLAGAGRRHPLAALPFVFGMLTLMGFPPTAGFFAKYYVFYAAVNAGGGMVWLAIIGVLTSAIGAYYYLRVIVYLFMREPQADAPKAQPMRSAYVACALVLSGYFVIKMGVTPDAYLDLALRASGPFF